MSERVVDVHGTDSLAYSLSPSKIIMQICLINCIHERVCGLLVVSSMFMGQIILHRSLSCLTQTQMVWAAPHEDALSVGDFSNIKISPERASEREKRKKVNFAKD